MTTRKIYGDFQTPDNLASEVCKLVRNLGFRPATIVEPTCGLGSFVRAAAGTFTSAQRIIAADINPDYVESTRGSLKSGGTASEVFVADVFTYDWARRIEADGPVLILGNPPWVTVSELGALSGANAPARRSTPGLDGLDAMTGKSNFDVAEWILNEACNWGQGRPRLIAMLCKTSVARKVLKRLWLDGRSTSLCQIRRIDAKAHFDVAVSACLLVIGLDLPDPAQSAEIHDSLGSMEPSGELALFRGQKLVSNSDTAQRLDRIYSPGAGEMWRSGVKHDCSSVMELQRKNGCWMTGSGECLDIEPDCVFPLFKSSDLAKGASVARRWVIVTQSSIGEDTAPIRLFQPKLWAYLDRNRSSFDRRGSSIYRGKPSFSMFGVGAYSFASWKVAVSGLYKQPRFVVLGPHEGKPSMVDDTCYFLPFDTEDEATETARCLNSEDGLAFLRAHSFSDDKRPLTTELLRAINIKRLKGEGDVIEQPFDDPGGLHWSDTLTDDEIIRMRA